ncbi:MAG TPA: hypothetical protein VG759_19845 [Candidatus Angelobacter sp.]|nr:hypothetical protein [Candidatus Angelobacter sp.]
MNSHLFISQLEGTHLLLLRSSSPYHRCRDESFGLPQDRLAEAHDSQANR